jgi:hypothetical protein
MEICDMFKQPSKFFEVKQAIDQLHGHKFGDLRYISMYSINGSNNYNYTPMVEFITHIIINKSEYLTHSIKFSS